MLKIKMLHHPQAVLIECTSVASGNDARLCGNDVSRLLLALRTCRVFWCLRSHELESSLRDANGARVTAVTVKLAVKAGIAVRPAQPS